MTDGNSLTVSPGVYVLNGGSVNLQSGPVTSSGGLTIYLTNGATVNIGYGVSVTLNAPTTGTYAESCFSRTGTIRESRPSREERPISSKVRLMPRAGKFSLQTDSNRVLWPVVAEDVDFESGTYNLNSDPGGNITGINSGSGGPGATYVVTMVE